MNCFFANNHLSAYLKEDLAPGIHSQLKVHLDECPSCRQNFKELKFVIDALKEIPKPALDRNIRGQIRCILAKSKPIKVWYKNFIFPPKIVSYLFLFTFLFILTGVFVENPNLFTPKGAKYLAQQIRKTVTEKTFFETAFLIPKEDQTKRIEEPLNKIEKQKILKEEKVIPPNTQPENNLEPQIQKPKESNVIPLESEPDEPQAESNPPTTLANKSTREEKTVSPTLDQEPEVQGDNEVEIQKPKEKLPSAQDSHEEEEAMEEPPKGIHQMVLITDSLSKSRRKILRECKKIGCRNLDGTRDIDFLIQENQGQMKFKIPPIKLAAFRDFLKELGQLNEKNIPEKPLVEDSESEEVFGEYFAHEPRPISLLVQEK